MAAADVEEAQHVATQEPSVPSESRQPRGQDTNGGARRRDGNQGRRKKLEQKYQISDLTVGMEVEGLVVRFERCWIEIRSAVFIEARDSASLP